MGHLLIQEKELPHFKQTDRFRCSVDSLGSQPNPVDISKSPLPLGTWFNTREQPLI